MSAVLRKEFWYFEITGEDLFVQIRCLRVLEGQEPADHGVENDAAAPNVGLKSKILLSSDHLWSCIARRPTSRFQLFLRAGSVHVT